MATLGPVLDRQLEAFYEHDYERIVASLRAKFRDDDLAREAVDEAVARAWVRFSGGRDVDCLPAWVRTVASNVVRDRLRRRATEERAIASTLRPDRAGPPPIELVDLDLDLARTLADLPPRQREIATLRYVHDLSCDQIASELGVSSGYVRQVLHRSRRALVVAMAVMALVVAAFMVRTDHRDPVRVDIAPATQPATPTTAAPPAVDVDGGGNNAVIVGDEAEDVVDDRTPAYPPATGNTRREHVSAPTTVAPAPVPSPALPSDVPAPAPVLVPSPAPEPPAPTTPTTLAAPVPTGEPTPDTVTVTCCDWGLGAPYRDVVHDGRASMWTIAPSGDITLRLYSPPSTSTAYSVHIAADSVSPAPPPNILGGWTVTIAPGELVTLQVHNLTSLQVKDCWVEGCRLEFFES